LIPPDNANDDPNLGLLLSFVNKVLAGDVDTETVDWLCASNLVVLLKLDASGALKLRSNGMYDVRPIAIPETL
jgi:hypothetical protein